MKRSRQSLRDTSCPVEEEVPKSPFSSLPLNIVCKIFADLSTQSKETARLVCQEWKSVLEEYFLRFHGFLDDENYDAIANSSVKFDTVSVCSFSRLLGTGMESNSLSRSKLAFGCRSLEFGTAISGVSTPAQNIITLLRLNRGIEALRFRLHSLKGIRHLPLLALHMQNLSRLEIAITKEIMSDPTVFTQISQLRLPRLSHLIFHVPKFIVFEQYKTGRFYVAMFDFIAKFNATLISLDVRTDYYLFFPLLALPTVSLPISREDLLMLRQNIARLQLMELTYLFKRPECYPPYNLGLHLLKSQHRLTKLKIEERNEHQMLLPIMVQVLAQNCNTLTELSWRVSSRLAEMSLSYLPITPDVLESLANCSQLHTLHLYGFRMETLGPVRVTPGMRSVHLEGDLSPLVLQQVGTQFPNVESLKFYHHVPVQRATYTSLTANLRNIMRLPKIRIIHWYICGLFLHYVPRRSDISIARGKLGRHYYVIRFKGR